MSVEIRESAGLFGESFGPFHTYLMTRGLVLNFSDTAAVVNDGVGSSLSFALACEANEWGLHSSDEYARVLDEIESIVGIRFVGFVGDPSDEIAFRVGAFSISSSSLDQGLLSRLLVLENLLRRRVLQDAKVNDLNLLVALNFCANVEDEISYGRISPHDLEALTQLLKEAEIPVEQGFFIFNADSIAEDMRYALRAACYHSHRMNSRLRTINQTTGTVHDLPGEPDEPWERRLSSGQVDELSYSYTSSIVACYTALDLLYAFFVYLTREPFLNPEFPSNLHFPDAPGRAIFQAGGSALPSDLPPDRLPYAIANLTSGQFGSLRNSRNALVHSMAPDSMRPRVYKGWKLPPVNNQRLQYTQYLSRDIDSDGGPVAHPWIRRFYENQADAQNGLIDWLELTWQCAFDTVEWLIWRWSNHVKGC